MALSEYELKTFVVHHSTDYPEIVAADEDDSMTIELDTLPVSGEKYIKKLNMDSTNSDRENVWKNAVNVAYNAAYDNITGTIFTLGPIVEEVQTYVERTFCMSLTGEPSQRGSYLHVYVSAPVGGGGGDPEDGSWTGDTN
jgi:hypothetical protein